jgi:hypothetical protein
MESPLFDQKSMLDVFSNLLINILSKISVFYSCNRVCFSVRTVCDFFFENSGLYIMFMGFFLPENYDYYLTCMRARVVLVIYITLYCTRFLFSFLFPSLFLFSYVSLWLIEYIFDVLCKCACALSFS